VGGIPNAVRRSPQLTPYLLTGEPIPHHLLAAHIFTEVVPTNEVLPAALRWAAKLVDASPEAVWATKEHINLHKDGLGVSAVVDAALETEVSKHVYRGENIQEGLRAFVEVSGLLLRFNCGLQSSPVDLYGPGRNATPCGVTLRLARSQSCKRPSGRRESHFVTKTSSPGPTCAPCSKKGAHLELHCIG
jgi:hypothetical protein